MNAKKAGTTFAVMHGPGTIGSQWCNFIQKMFTEELPEEYRDMNLDIITESVSNLGEDDVCNINNCDYKMLLLDSEVLKIMKDENSIFRQCEIMEMQQERVIVLLLGNEDDLSFNHDARSCLARLKDNAAFHVIHAKNPDQIFSDIITILSPLYIVPHPNIMSCDDKEQHLTLLSNKPFPAGQGAEYVVKFTVGTCSKECSATIFNPHTLLLQNPGQMPGIATIRIYSCTHDSLTENDIPDVDRKQVGDDLKIWFQSDLDQIFSILDSQLNPMSFLCQVVEDGRDQNRSTEEKVDKLLTESFKTCVPNDKLSIVFGNAQNFSDAQDCNRPEFLPTLLHFSALYGLRDLTAALLQCPGAVLAYGTANCDGDFPTNLAEKSGHWELRDFMNTYMEVAAMVHNDYGKNSTRTSQIMSSMFYGQYLSFPEATGIPEEIYVPIDAGGSDSLSTPSGYVTMHAASTIASLPQSLDYDCMIKRILETSPEEPEKDYEELDVMGLSAGARRRTSDGSSSLPPLRPPRDDKKLKDSLDPQNTPLLLLPTIHSNMSPAQEELISLQKQVKNEELTINQAVFRFKEWERKNKERAASFQYQQENLQRIRNSLMRSRQERGKKGESTSIKISDPLVAGSSTYDAILLKTRNDITKKTMEEYSSQPITGKSPIHDDGSERRSNEYSQSRETSCRIRSRTKKSSFFGTPTMSSELPGRSCLSIDALNPPPLPSSLLARSSPTFEETLSRPLSARQSLARSSKCDNGMKAFSRSTHEYGQVPPLPPRTCDSRRVLTSNEPRPVVPPRSPVFR